MRKLIGAMALVAALTAAPVANAGQAFCEGWRDGWASAFQNRRKIVAITPICPIPPVGRNHYSGGYEMGLLAALERMNR